MKNWFFYRLKYELKCWIYLPITFIKRVILGKDKLPKRFFWDKWGFLSKTLIKLAASKNTIWVVANSGGEITQSISLLKKLKNSFPNYNLILSTESYDAFQYAQKLKEVDFVFFSPWDMPFTCKRVLKKIKPRILIFIEHCYLPILAKEAKDSEVTNLLCSGKIDFNFLKENYLLERSFTLKFYNFMDGFAVKGKEDCDNLTKMGVDIEKITILGDMRLDLGHILLDEDKKERLKRELKFSKDDLIFIVGSIHKQEVDIILQVFKILRRSYSNLKLIFAPRWKNDIPFIENTIIDYGYTYKWRSRLDSTDKDTYEILIIDTFGELPYLYGIASVAFIGSSMVSINVRRLGHNIFEPLAHGIPTLFGPHMNSYCKITDSLKEIWSGCLVYDSGSLADSIKQIFKDEGLSQRLKSTALRLSKPNCNIVNKHLEFIERLIY